MRPPRLRIGTLMILAALIGVLVASFKFRGLSAEYQKRANLFEYWETFYSSPLSWATKDGGQAVMTPAHVEALQSRERDHYRRLKEKYRYAARYPWVGVEPDPPEPSEPGTSAW